MSHDHMAIYSSLRVIHPHRTTSVVLQPAKTNSGAVDRGIYVAYTYDIVSINLYLPTSAPYYRCTEQKIRRPRPLSTNHTIPHDQSPARSDSMRLYRRPSVVITMRNTLAP